jgi:hypothetical protein
MVSVVRRLMMRSFRGRVVRQQERGSIGCVHGTDEAIHVPQSILRAQLLWLPVRGGALKAVGETAAGGETRAAGRGRLIDEMNHGSGGRQLPQPSLGAGCLTPKTSSQI